MKIEFSKKYNQYGLYTREKGGYYRIFGLIYMDVFYSKELIDHYSKYNTHRRILSCIDAI
jgi:hypothetical protein